MRDTIRTSLVALIVGSVAAGVYLGRERGQTRARSRDAERGAAVSGTRGAADGHMPQVDARLQAQAAIESARSTLQGDERQAALQEQIEQLAEKDPRAPAPNQEPAAPCHPQIERLSM